MPGAELPEREVEARQIDGFLGGLTVTPSKGVIEIRYRSSDPGYAADMANAHAQEYIEQNLELRFAAIEEELMQALPRWEELEAKQ